MAKEKKPKPEEEDGTVAPSEMHRKPSLANRTTNQPISSPSPQIVKFRVIFHKSRKNI